MVSLWGVETERWCCVPQLPVLGAPGIMSHRQPGSGAQKGTQTVCLSRPALTHHEVQDLWASWQVGMMGTPLLLPALRLSPPHCPGHCGFGDIVQTMSF